MTVFRGQHLRSEARWYHDNNWQLGCINVQGFVEMLMDTGNGGVCGDA